MAKTPAQKTAPKKPANPRAKGLKLVGVRLRTDQVDVLRAEAQNRADERNTSQVDVSEVVREAIDKVWMKRR